MVRLLRSGIVPLNTFVEACTSSSVVKPLKLVGSDPLNLLSYKYNTRSLVRLPHDGGMLPNRELFANLITCN